jgi:hypothetical protein
LFRRTKTDTAPSPAASEDLTDAQKKGRPTPSRKEAEAARKARAKVPRTRKEMAAARKLERSTSSNQMRQAMKGGDQRYLPARDQGPVKHFIRDYIDSRFSLIELLIPLMLMVLLLGWTGSSTIRSFANLAMLSVLVLIVVDLIRLRFRLRRQLTARFPEADLKGTTYYAAMRSMSMRFMRMPKPQVKVGQKLPERYR